MVKIAAEISAIKYLVTTVATRKYLSLNMCSYDLLETGIVAAGKKSATNILFLEAVSCSGRKICHKISSARKICHKKKNLSATVPWLTPINTHNLHSNTHNSQLTPKLFQLPSNFIPTS